MSKKETPEIESILENLEQVSAGYRDYEEGVLEQTTKAKSESYDILKAPEVKKESIRDEAAKIEQDSKAIWKTIKELENKFRKIVVDRRYLEKNIEKYTPQKTNEGSNE